MATTGTVRGRDYILHNNAVQITKLTSCEMTLARETIDVTTSDSSDNKETLDGDESFGFSASFLTDFQGAEGIDEIGADYQSGGTVAVLMTTGSSGDTTYSGNCRITNFTVSNPRDGVSSVSVTYEGTGALTIDTVL